jgi:hypothetical protein
MLAVLAAITLHALSIAHRLCIYRPQTLNQTGRTRAKSAPVHARIVQLQAVSSGSAARLSWNDRSAESRPTMRKTAQQS